VRLVVVAVSRLVLHLFHLNLQVFSSFGPSTEKSKNRTYNCPKRTEKYDSDWPKKRASHVTADRRKNEKENRQETASSRASYNWGLNANCRLWRW
jgi:hypothetical protein